MGDQIRVSELIEQIREIGQNLIRLSSSTSGDNQSNNESAIVFRSESDIDEFSTERLRLFAHMARQEYESRFSRTSIINRNIFGEPAWDMLLDLFVARVEGVRLSVKAVCIASQVPPTTALRWITVLENEGLVDKSQDSADGRRLWIELSDLGMHRMFAYFKDLTSKSVNQYSFKFAAPSPRGGQ